MIFLSILTGCDNLFSPENISGTWIEAEYNFSSSNSDNLCSTDDIIPNDSAFEYQFSTPPESNETDTGFRNSDDILASIELGRSNLWAICEYYDEEPQFDCPYPLLILHLDDWKERFPLFTKQEQYSCQFWVDRGSTRGLFIDDNNIILTGTIAANCTSVNNNIDSKSTSCSIQYSSRLTKQ